MKNVFPAFCLVIFVLLSGQRDAGLMGQGTADLSSVESQRALITQYCAGCHSDSVKSGGFTWSAIDLAHPEQNVVLGEKIIRKVRSGMMPPSGSRRPDLATMKAFAAGFESRVDQASAAKPHTRSPELHRMNRTEYQNSVRDLLDLQVDVGELLPPDARTSSGVAGGGFDNMSEALTITPTLLSAYVRAADKVSRDAIGDPNAGTAMKTYKVSRLQNQMRHIDGAPEGTRGGTSVLHTFPADGEYIFKATFYYYYTEQLLGSSLPNELQNQQLEISIDGERVALITIDPTVQESDANYSTFRTRVRAGQRRLSAAFIAKFDGPVQDHNRLIENTILDTTISITPEMTGLPHLQALAVTGPFDPTGVSESASRARIFTCRPTAPAQNERCASDIIKRLAAQAFRRPANAEDLESLMSFYRSGAQDGGFEEGVRSALQAILSKPEFIFRFEKKPSNATADQTYKISDLELASRLAYFLWSSLPDEQLVNVASQGKLSDPVVLEQQIKRMLADRRSAALSTNFASQWLRLTGLKDTAPESCFFPNFTRQLASSMRREVELLFDNVVHENRNVLDLLTADYTFVDEILARHYGIPNVSGRISDACNSTDPNRFGLLGKARHPDADVTGESHLARRARQVRSGSHDGYFAAAAAARRSAAERNKCDNQRVLTVRERMEQHRANPACASCHKIMDPIGLSLENFDAVGLWRVRDAGSSRSQRRDVRRLEVGRTRQPAKSRHESFRSVHRQLHGKPADVWRSDEFWTIAICRRSAPLRASAAKDNNRFQHSLWAL